jgi:Flp pilus assembly protein CpaB
VASPRSRLPSGRAALGALLVAVAAVGLFAAYLSARSGPSGRFVVAAADLAPGTRIGPDDVRVAAIDLPGEVADRAFTAPDDVIGSVTVAPLNEGELLQASAVDADAQPDSPGYTMSFAIGPDRAAGGRLDPGQRITILVTYTNGQESVTQVVAEGATVVAYSEAGDAAIDALGESVITVRLPETANPLEVAHAARVGEMTIIDTSFAGPLELEPEFRPELPGAGSSEPSSGE